MSKIENKDLVLLFRTDASIRGGTGHVMRCLALAQACKQSGGSIHFLLAQSTPNLDQRLSAAGIALSRGDFAPGSEADALATVNTARAIKASWVISDGYAFDGSWQKQVKAAGVALLLLDDYGHADHYFADLVLNQNLDASEDLYASREAYTRLLLGTRFALLRDEFVLHPTTKREINERAAKILVTLGGSDPNNVTRDVIEILAAVPDVEVKVVAGGSNPHLEGLRDLAAGSPASLHLVVDSHEMPELMGWADLAIAAGGTTCWELAFSGLPSVIITLAQNQEAISAALDRAGVAVSVGAWGREAKARLKVTLDELISDRDRRAQMSERAQRLVDGLGRQRVLDILKNPPSLKEQD